jgi:hypothetical protein|tara:strand:- start:2152 stop:2343 length:192 start_codon:yes stop_codon:yes gene_type:complete
MKEAYIKGIKVINSCKNYLQVMTTYNYIHNFRVAFGNRKGCEELTQKLYERCHKKRKITGEIR